MLKAETLHDLLDRGVEFAYDCEQQLVKALPGVVEVVQSDELRDIFEQHLEQTKLHEERLKQIFAGLNRAASADTNHAIQSMVGESERLIKHIDRSPLLDAALILNGNQWEHYQIALYGSLHSFAHVLGLYEFAGLLEQTLSEEKDTDRALTQIAKNSINREASRFHNSARGFPLI